jgi:predicted dehydrogenase
MIRVGIAGFGKIGRLRFKHLNEHQGFIVVAILEKNAEVKTPSEIYRASSFSDLINQSLDAVFICAFNDVLAQYTVEAIKKNIHVFCEKPPARTVDELMNVSSKYSESDVVLKYGFNHRYHYNVIEAKRMISDGKFGKLISARGVYGKAGSIDYDKNWRNYKKVSGGGILIDQGIHMLDLLRHLSNDEYMVKHALIKTLFWNIEAEDNAFILLEGEKGAIASIHSSATQWRHKFLLELTFENGYINLDGILSGTRSYAPETIKYGLREFEDITWAMGKPQEHTIWFENDHSWQLEIKEFYNSIQGGQKVENGSIEDAVKTLSLVESVYKFDN